MTTGEADGITIGGGVAAGLGPYTIMISLPFPWEAAQALDAELKSLIAGHPTDMTIEELRLFIQMLSAHQAWVKANRSK